MCLLGQVQLYWVGVITGHDSKIGAGAIVFHDIPPHSTVVGINEIKVGGEN